MPDKKTVPFRDERRPENKVCESEIYRINCINYLRDLLFSEPLEELDELRLPEEDGLDSVLPEDTEELLLLCERGVETLASDDLELEVLLTEGDELLEADLVWLTAGWDLPTFEFPLLAEDTVPLP